MIGRPAEDVIRNDVHALLHPSLAGVATCDLKRCRLNAALHGRFESGDSEETFFRDDGASFPVEYSASSIQDESGRPVGTVIMFRDVTEKRAAAVAAERERRYRPAEAQTRAQAQFLAP